MQGEEVTKTKTRHLIIKGGGNFDFDLDLYKNPQMHVPRFIQVLQTKGQGNTIYLSDYCGH